MRIITGEFRGRPLQSVKGEGYRPATGRVREALFSLLEARGLRWSDSAVLDLFAGSGSLAFEAASRGASSICLVELAGQAVRCLAANAAKLGLAPPRCRIIQADVLRLLGGRDKSALTQPQGFDLVFIDPPYGKNLVPPVLRELVHKKRLAPRALIVAELEATAALDPDAQQELVCLDSRKYGQTRILIWQTVQSSPGPETTP